MKKQLEELNTLYEKHTSARSTYQNASAALIAVVGKIELRQAETCAKIEQEIKKLDDEKKRLNEAAKDSARGRARALIYGDVAPEQDKGISARLSEISEERAALEYLKQCREVTESEREEYVAALCEAEAAANESRAASNTWLSALKAVVDALNTEQNNFLSIPRPFGTLEDARQRFDSLDQSPNEEATNEYNTPYGVLKGGRKI